MKIEELVNQLKRYDKNYDVILAIDEEGNYFSKLREISSECIDYDDYYEIKEDGEANSIVLWP